MGKRALITGIVGQDAHTLPNFYWKRGTRAGVETAGAAMGAAGSKSSASKET
jgi:GDP-D-mannose dehydratase